MEGLNKTPLGEHGKHNQKSHGRRGGGGLVGSDFANGLDRREVKTGREDTVKTVKTKKTTATVRRGASVQDMGGRGQSHTTTFYSVAMKTKHGYTRRFQITYSVAGLNPDVTGGRWSVVGAKVTGHEFKRAEDAIDYAYLSPPRKN